MSPRFLLVILLTSLLPAQEPSERILTLQESLRLASLNRVEVKIAEQEIERARTFRREASSFLYPQIDVTASFSRLNSDKLLSLTPLLSGAVLRENLGQNYYFTRIGFTQMLYPGGGLLSRRSLAVQEVKRMEAVRDRLSFQARTRAKKAFAALLSAQARAALTAFVDEAARQNLLRDLMLARLDFLEALGLELDTEVRLVGETAVPEGMPDLQRCLAAAFQFRPEMKEARSAEKMEGLAASLTSSARYPTVAIGGGYQIEDEDFPLKGRSWHVTAAVNFPIFDGGASWARIRRSGVNRRQKALLRAEMEDRIRMEVQRAFILYEYARGAWDRFGVGVKRRGKLSPMEELLRLGLWRDAAVAKAELEGAMGRDLEDLP